MDQDDTIHTEGVKEGYDETPGRQHLWEDTTTTAIEEHAAGPAEAPAGDQSPALASLPSPHTSTTTLTQYLQSYHIPTCPFGHGWSDNNSTRPTLTTMNTPIYPQIWASVGPSTEPTHQKQGNDDEVSNQSKTVKEV